MQGRGVRVEGGGVKQLEVVGLLELVLVAYRLRRAAGVQRRRDAHDGEEGRVQRSQSGEIEGAGEHMKDAFTLSHIGGKRRREAVVGGSVTIAGGVCGGVVRGGVDGGAVSRWVGGGVDVGGGK